MFRRWIRRRRAMEQKAFFDLIGKIREALKDFLFTSEDRKNFQKLKDDCVKHQKELEKMRLVVKDQSLDVARLFKDVNEKDEVIKALSEELHGVKSTMSSAAKVVQDGLNK